MVCQAKDEWHCDEDEKDNARETRALLDYNDGVRGFGCDRRGVHSSLTY